MFDREIRYEYDTPIGPVVVCIGWQNSNPDRKVSWFASPADIDNKLSREARVELEQNARALAAGKPPRGWFRLKNAR